MRHCTLVFVLVAVVAADAVFFGSAALRRVAVPGAALTGASRGLFYQVAGNLFEKARGGAGFGHVISVAAAVAGAGDEEGIHGAGEADVAEAALLFHLVRIAERARMREETFLHA